MIKNTLNKIIFTSAFFTLLSCGEEKKQAQPKEQSVEIKDSIVAPVAPEAAVEAPISTYKDTIIKHSPVSNPEVIGCQMLRQGTFTYKDPQGEEVKVTISDNTWTEEHKNRQYVTIAMMKWTGECEYQNTLLMSSLPGFSLPPGTVMDVVIDKIKDNDIYFTATAAGKSYHNVLTKVK